MQSCEDVLVQTSFKAFWTEIASAAVLISFYYCECGFLYIISTHYQCQKYNERGALIANKLLMKRD